ncbi:phage tail tape measure protein [Lachnospiraceae bacterium 38-14]
MDEFLILLQAKLDEAKSKGNVNADIKELQNQLDKLKVQVEIDPKSLTKIVKQLESTLGQKINIPNITVDSKVGEQIGNNIADNIANGISKASGKVDAEVQKLANQVNKIQLSMTDKSAPKDNYELQIKKLTDQLSNLGLTNEEVSQKTRVLTESQAELKKVIDSTNYNSINEKNQAILSADEKRSTALNQVKNAYEDAKLAYDKYMQPVSNEKATSLINRINTFLSKNTKITKDARIELEGFVQELGRGDTTLNRWNQINGTLKKTENSMRGLHRLGASLKEQMSQAAQSFTQWLSISSAVMLIVSKTRNAISELKEINTLLTEISKANDKLSKSDLNKIGNNSFDIASKYGKNATDYLSGVQEASRAGYENAEAIAELSVAAQGAGDMTDELANKYIIATDKAYKLGGSVEKLTEVLDGSNYITNHNAVNMTELAEAMSIVGSTAASFGVEANETTAVLGTMIATTQQSGSEMARAFRAILLNIRQVSDEEEGIDAEGLTKYEKACNALGVSLKETKDGILQTRDAMEVLRDLSVEYNQLEENDLRRTDLLNSVGGKLRANALDAILKNFDMYSKMLDEYAQGTGSMAVEAEKTANSWEGSMNRLGNTWKDTVENIADSDAIITIINCLNILLSVVNNVTDKLGSLGTIGLGAGLFAGFKNAGRVKCNPSQGICLL